MKSITHNRTLHDNLRDRIAVDYHNLPPMLCRFCDAEVALPPCDFTDTEYSIAIDGVRMRVDVAALLTTGEPIAAIEVIATHPPRLAVLEAQKRLPAVFYVKTDVLQGNKLSGWCSPGCWEFEHIPIEERVCNLWFVECVDCQKLLYYSGGGDYPHSENLIWGKEGFLRWDDGDGHDGSEHCLACAASIGIAQWNTPGAIAFGDTGILPPIPGDADAIFLAWSNAAFWHMVWNERTMKTPARYGAETETAKRLDEIENAFDRGDWAAGAELLQPIGSSWLQVSDVKLWAWNPNNCDRVARAWDSLREYLLQSLPAEIAELIPPPQPPQPPPPPFSPWPPTHRGFPDGRFTQCGIDRHKSEVPVNATMSKEVTCPNCR